MTEVRRGLPQPDEWGNFDLPTGMYVPGIIATKDIVQFDPELPSGATHDPDFYRKMAEDFGELPKQEQH